MPPADSVLPPADGVLPVRIEAFGEDELPASLAAQVRALTEQAWPAAPDAPAGPDRHHQAGRLSKTGHDRALAPVTMVLTSKSQLLATLTLLTKQIEHAGARYTVSGLSAVVTGPDHRGSGYGHRLISAAREQLAGSGADLALFTCDRQLQEFYRRAGWTLLAGTVLIGGTVEDPFPSDQFDKVCLGALFSARAVAAGTTFRGSRVELFPGDLDRLW